MGDSKVSWMSALFERNILMQSAVAKWVKEHPQPVWFATYIYFVYVVLGGIHQ